MRPDQNAVWQQIAPGAELTGEALARVIRRLCAGYAVSFPLRADTDPAPLIAWLKAAGAAITLSADDGVPPMICSNIS
jgi:hypothetical protein